MAEYRGFLSNHQKGNLNKGWSRFRVLLIDHDGGNNQNEDNESSVANLSSPVPAVTASHTLTQNKKSVSHNNSIASKLTAEQPKQAQSHKSNINNKAHNIKDPRTARPRPPPCKPFVLHVIILETMHRKTY